jgi:EAL domain-containing protein (putative c-di-GMP-specific phosphodiesterase class I)
VSESTLMLAILAPGGLSVRFQPILDITGPTATVHGFECLMRGPAGTNVENAEVLFDYVRKKREESLVDRTCLATALRAAQRLPGSPHLSINVHASTLGRDHGFLDFVAEAAEQRGIAVTRLTIEIVEHAPAWDGPSFARALEGLRRMGIAIALDDVGLGQSNYRMMLDCAPDYFKIDRYLVTGVSQDLRRQAVVESVAQLARRFGARVVAEGVETEDELEVVRRADVGLVQGHLFSPALDNRRCTEALQQVGQSGRWPVRRSEEARV